MIEPDTLISDEPAVDRFVEPANEEGTQLLTFSNAGPRANGDEAATVSRQADAPTPRISVHRRDEFWFAARLSHLRGEAPADLQAIPDDQEKLVRLRRVIGRLRQNQQVDAARNWSINRSALSRRESGFEFAGEWTNASLPQ